MLNWFRQLANVRKLVVYIASAVISAANESGLIPPQYVHYVTLVVFFLTSIGIYAARNVKPSAATAVAAAGAAVSTVASGQLPSLDELEAELDDLAGGKHEAPAAPTLPATLPAQA